MSTVTSTQPPGLLIVGPLIGKVIGLELLIESCRVTAERVALAVPLFANHMFRTVALAWPVSYPII